MNNWLLVLFLGGNPTSTPVASLEACRALGEEWVSGEERDYVVSTGETCLNRDIRRMPGRKVEPPKVLCKLNDPWSAWSVRDEDRRDYECLGAKP